MSTDADIVEILQQSPGLSGFRIHQALLARSRVAKWFGPDSFLTALFGPGTGSMYLSLWQLERDGVLTSHWGVATPERSGYRPRHYYVRRATAVMATEREVQS